MSMFFEVLERARVVADEATVQQAVDNMAEQIQRQFGEDSLLLMTVMQGGLMTAAWLASRLDCDVTMDYLHVSGYGKNTTGGELVWHASPRSSLEDRRIVLVDDILDQGHTLETIHRACQASGAAQVVSAVLVDKQHDRKTDYRADIVGLELPDQFLMGCGMDWRGHGRQLPYICAVAEQDS